MLTYNSAGHPQRYVKLTYDTMQRVAGIEILSLRDGGMDKAMSGIYPFLRRSRTIIHNS